MTQQVWVNGDGLPLFFGADKATASTAGDYLSYGANRLVEGTIDLSTLITANATVISRTTILPAMANLYVEKIELVAEVLMSTASSPTLSIGVCKANGLTGGATTVTLDGTAYTTATVPTNGATAFVSAAAASTLTQGALLTITKGGTAAGNYLGDYEDVTNLKYPMYLTATLGTATATGLIRYRIFYHGVGTITQ